MLSSRHPVFTVKLVIDLRFDMFSDISWYTTVLSEMRAHLFAALCIAASGRGLSQMLCFAVSSTLKAYHHHIGIIHTAAYYIIVYAIGQPGGIMPVISYFPFCKVSHLMS